MSQKYTKFLMSISGIAMISAGITITFLTNEIIAYLNFKSDVFLLVQMIGAFYFAFGMLNWQAKANLIGGIYSRPVAMANFIHFFIVAVSLFKSAHSNSITFILLTFIYTLLAALFGYVLFTHPKV